MESTNVVIEHQRSQTGNELQKIAEGFENKDGFMGGCPNLAFLSIRTLLPSAMLFFSWSRRVRN